MEFKATDIAAFLNGEIVGDGDVKVFNVSKIEEGKQGTLTFLANIKYENHIYETNASIITVKRIILLTFTKRGISTNFMGCFHKHINRSNNL